ncbi:TM0106 family RecB-like putative nuclease [Agrococcus versicolor]|uniref:TM0106 family RecB-like putative nuclease n=1 Tax=Agrococcus versicolor TaxID=501482 RepID=A0ABP5MNU5_9MICO
MFLRDGLLLHSASDLRAASDCEFAMLRALDARLGRLAAVDEPDDPMLQRAGRLGDAHEERILQAYRDRAAREPGYRVVEIARPSPMTLDGLRDAREASLAAMRDGADVVFQATFLDESTGFMGFADFLVRVDGAAAAPAYAVYDAKLARSAKTTALLQLAAYALELRREGIPVDETVHLILGTGVHTDHLLADVVPVFERAMGRMRGLLAERRADDAPIAWDTPGIRQCGRCATCAVEVERTRDVLLVAGLRRTQRDRMRAAGVATIDALAASTGGIVGIGDATLASLRTQARLQLAAPASGVLHEVFDRAPLGRLPEPSPGDVFFDFEGDPLWWDGEHWGIDYLFGATTYDEGGEVFTPFWAHDFTAEGVALAAFLDWLAARRARWPSLHVYHYAPYERTHLAAIAARHGVREDEVADLLAADVLVDLYPIVRGAVRISESSYSLKRLEPLFMGERLRDSAVKDGGASIVAYQEVGRLRGDGDVAAAESLLAEIADYNRYDCAATLGLRDWLVGLADAEGIGRRRAVEVPPDASARLEAREEAVDARLRARIAGVPADERTDEQLAVALAAAAVEYHRREDTAHWVEHFARLGGHVDLWQEQRDVLVPVDVAIEVVQPWHTPARARQPRRTLRLVGAMAAGSRLGPGDRPYAVYATPAPIGDPDVADTYRAHDAVRVVEASEDAGTWTVVLDERDVAGDGWAQLPIALAPGRPIPTTTQRSAILEWGERVAANADPIADPALDVLRREPPRIRGGVPGPEHGSPAERIRAALEGMDRSYLAVQGPPGTGKTHVGASVLRELVARGWRIGVVAQSHDVVEHLLQKAIDLGVPTERVGKRPRSGATTVPGTPLDTRDIASFVAREGGCILGGTAWTFSNADQVPRRSLDLLVVDEAGQFSLANTIACAVAADRLLLLGDPQQLPQVSQGTHPEPIDASALGWLSRDSDVLPPQLGVFLERSWRMHPVLCAAVSTLSYRGELTSAPIAARRMLAGAPGVHAVHVDHEGASVESPQEAAEVVRLVRDQLGRAWLDPSVSDEPRPLTAADVIVVAPYNAQVDLLRRTLDAAGLGDARVGTADRFQGQEAVVAIVSLTASSADDAPRGIEFVLQRNRINVAISRAQWSAYVVHSPRIADALPYRADGLAQLSGFLRLTGRG